MTFGFDSAVSTVVDGLDRLHTTAQSHKRVMVLEVMGRHAGWIALWGGMAGADEPRGIPGAKIAEGRRAGEKGDWGCRVVGREACLMLRFVTGRRLWIVSVGSVRIAASRRIGIVREVSDPVSLEMD
jgi:hypothetical protein